MLFSSSIFLFLFLPLVILIYYLPLRKWRQGQNVFLLCASLFFYAWGEPWFVLVMIGSILLNYAFGLWVAWAKERGKSTRPAIVATVLVNIGLLYIFKYLTFTLEVANQLGANFLIPVIRLPIGISFFTFQAMSYVLDVNRGRGQVQRSPLKVGLYVSFFPQLIAGPIVKYETVAAEIDGRKETWEDFSAGICRFAVGLGKKVLIANQIAIIADRAFALPPGELSAGFAWLGSICYTLQVYYDFSGYSDMAIGMGRMFGFHFLENFNYPLISKSITELWRRWHISLVTWFRDYVYFPLGGSRVSTPKRVRNLLVVWLCTGIWHGANWTFLVWGLIYFALQILEKYAHLGRGWPGGLQWLYAVGMYNFNSMLFRSDSLSHAWGFLKSMFGLGGGWWDEQASYYLLENIPVLAAAVVFAAPVAVWVREWLNSGSRAKLAPVWDVGYTLLILGLMAISASYIIKGTYNPFIYFNF